MFCSDYFRNHFRFSSYHIVKAEKGDGYPEKIDHYLKASLFFPALDGYEALSARHFTRLLQSMPLIEDNIDQRRKIAAYAVEKADEAIKKCRDKSGIT